MSRRSLMEIKIEDLIDITCKVDDILHDYGFVVSHDILSMYILRTIKESYPNDDVQLGKPDMAQLMKNLEHLKNKDLKNASVVRR